MPRPKITLDDLLNPKPLRWPRRGDRLFAQALAQGTRAEIHSSAYERAVFMMEGYKLAADYLVKEAIADTIDRHDLVYPILFCYRQFLELSLKWLIKTYGTRVGIELPNGGQHDLKQLLRRFRMLNHEAGAVDNAATIAVSKCILEFHAMDRTSFTFRYPSHLRTGVPYPVTSDQIDLDRLKDVMAGIHGYFTGCDGFFDSVFNV